ncbi:hypothetical protein AB0B89_32995 [Sphaerisporangium sp. NPDC049002]|uniref:hypothetical protein n=1 Tax=unclassified Sphaerisporangium TaxID=2630420 RepID=UPI0033E898B2
MVRRRTWLWTGSILGVIGSLGAVTLVASSTAETNEREAPALEVGGRLPGHDPKIIHAVEGLFAGDSGRYAATEELIYRCMTGKGLPYVKRKGPDRDANPTLVADTYGTPLSEARSTGYRSKEHLQTSEDGDSSGLGQLSEKDKQRWGDAFFGRDDAPVVSVTLPQGGTTETSSDGCLSEARSRLFGSLEDWLKWGTFAGSFAMEVQQQVKSDSRITDLNRRWSDCMAEAGHMGLKDPEAAREVAASGHALQRVDSEEAQNREVELATADAKCDSAISYSENRRKIEDQFYATGLAKHESDIAGLRKMNDRASAEARKIQETPY